jgi:hypothetical protein
MPGVPVRDDRHGSTKGIVKPMSWGHVTLIPTHDDPQIFTDRQLAALNEGLRCSQLKVRFADEPE